MTGNLNGTSKEQLRQEILSYFEQQGFDIESGIGPKNNHKSVLRKIHQQKKDEQIHLHCNFLRKNFELAKKYSISGIDLDPENINLKLIEVKSDSWESKLFLWWNLTWWSLPFERAFGRQMRFILWDDYHNAPFGLIGLQSPPLASSVRDRYLGLVNGNRDVWINQSMYGQRIGALPPYNQLIGGKMVALTLTSNELRTAYQEKYKDRVTLLENRVLPNSLLFITTTSAFGKSSMYERLKYHDESVSKFIGFTSGAGTFQLSEELYRKCLNYLEENGKPVKRGYGTGPSRKLKLMSDAMRLLGINNYHYHNIRRGYYLFSLTENLKQVLHGGQTPSFVDRPFSGLVSFWKERWGIPRSKNKNEWKSFDKMGYFSQVEEIISQ